MEKHIAVLAGDGIGEEVMNAALKVLDAIAERYQHKFHYHHALIGGAAFDQYGVHCPSQTLMRCQDADAILFGSVGGPVAAQNDPKWKGCEANSILALRQHFNFSINIRPIAIYSSLSAHCPLKTNRIGNGASIEIFRELSGDIYFGEHRQDVDKNGRRYAIDVAEYDESQIRHIVRSAFESAQKRRKILCSVDKANVLSTSRLWREIVEEEKLNFPDVKLSHLYVDNCAMQLVINPTQFDVLVMGNLFGDIISDLAAVLPGSLGLIPSASLNADGFGLYEPSGGSAFDIAGQNIANPIAQILSAAMMLSYSFSMHEEAKAIHKAVEDSLNQGYRTSDIALSNEQTVPTDAMANAIINNIKHGQSIVLS
ncbi:MAG: 3-isopropylmalate dehydrogenase [Francisellaceae bacterium]